MSTAKELRECNKHLSKLLQLATCNAEIARVENDLPRLEKKKEEAQKNLEEWQKEHYSALSNLRRFGDDDPEIVCKAAGYFVGKRARLDDLQAATAAYNRGLGLLGQMGLIDEQAFLIEAGFDSPASFICKTDQHRKLELELREALMERETLTKTAALMG